MSGSQFGSNYRKDSLDFSCWVYYITWTGSHASHHPTPRKDSAMSSINTQFKYTLTKRHIVDNLAQRMSLPQEEALKIVDMIFEQMSESLASGARIELRDFGVFEPKTLNSFVSRTPLSQKGSCIIPERRTVSFHPSKRMRDLLNGNDQTKDDPQTND